MMDRKKINTILICAMIWVAVAMLVAIGFYASLRICYRPSDVLDADDILGKTKEEIILKYGDPDVDYEDADGEKRIGYLVETDRFLMIYNTEKFRMDIAFNDDGIAYKMYECYVELSGI